jgi:hypothetical protein
MNTNNGHAGYGFKLRGAKGRRTKVPDPKEQQVMRWIAEQRQAGWSWERIYLELAKRKERTRAGKEWSVSRIRRAYAAEVAGKTREPIRKPPRKRRLNLAAAEWLHQFVRAFRKSLAARSSCSAWHRSRTHSPQITRRRHCHTHQ